MNQEGKIISKTIFPIHWVKRHGLIQRINKEFRISVAEPHHFYAAPAPGENFDVASAPTLLYSRPKFLKVIQFNRSDILFSSYSVLQKL
jgi:hypothetical protein